MFHAKLACGDMYANKEARAFSAHHASLALWLAIPLRFVAKLSFPLFFMDLSSDTFALQLTRAVVPPMGISTQYNVLDRTPRACMLKNARQGRVPTQAFRCSGISHLVLIFVSVLV